MEVLRWILICLSVPLILLMAIQTRKRAKALEERIEEYKEEQEAAKATPGPINPYDDLAALVRSNREQSAKDRAK